MIVLEQRKRTGSRVDNHGGSLLRPGGSHPGGGDCDYDGKVRFMREIHAIAHESASVLNRRFAAGDFGDQGCYVTPALLNCDSCGAAKTTRSRRSKRFIGVLYLNGYFIRFKLTSTSQLVRPLEIGIVTGMCWGIFVDRQGIGSTTI